MPSWDSRTCWPETDDIAGLRVHGRRENNDLLLKLISISRPFERSRPEPVRINYGMLDVNSHVGEEAVRSLRLGRCRTSPSRVLFGDHEAMPYRRGRGSCCGSSQFINNAVKFTEQRLHHAGLPPGAGDLLFYVRIRGRIISEKASAHCFDRFVQLQQLLRGAPAQGFRSPKSIVEQMGGHIGVSRRRPGLPFLVSPLPVVACNAGPDDEQPSVVSEGASFPVRTETPVAARGRGYRQQFPVGSLMFLREVRHIVRAVGRGGAGHAGDEGTGIWWTSRCP